MKNQNTDSSSNAWLPGSSLSSSTAAGGQDHISSLSFQALYQALNSGDWETAKTILQNNPAAATASLTPVGETALHVAVLAGHKHIVERLVAEFIPSVDDLFIKNRRTGATSLHHAAMGGSTTIAAMLVRRAPKLSGVPNKKGEIPVVVAAQHGHGRMVRYLYRVTHKDELVVSSPGGTRNVSGPLLLTTCVVDGIYDVALDLLQSYPQLAFEKNGDNETALEVLAQASSAFPSGATLGLWQRWTYAQLHSLPESISNSLRYLVPGLKHIHDLEWTHAQTQELLHLLSQHLRTLPQTEFEQTGSVHNALLEAVSHGVAEVVSKIIKEYPDIVWAEDEKRRGIFLSAVRHRQEKVFSLIYKMGAKKNAMAKSSDVDGNNILHQAAFLAPAWRLSRVPGAALQMQRELQWYNEVKGIVQPRHIEMRNEQQQTPWDLFTEQHKPPVEAGEKWMKDTATSCSVVAALIATIMFSALFTAPGGFDQTTGLPVYLHRNSFMVYVVADAISLFASSVSMLMFLRLLTSRYQEEDFLRFLPRKLIFGLSTLFLSMSTMMITFGISLVIFLRERFRWMPIPIMVLASIPVMLFARLQFPLLIQIISSTYGPGIFDKPKKKRMHQIKRFLSTLCV